MYSRIRKKISSVIYNRSCQVRNLVLAERLSKGIKIDYDVNLAKKSIGGKFSLVCIARNEDKFIDEWVAFHLNMGVDMVFFYDNAETDSAANKTRAILERHIREGKVFYIRIRDFEGQRLGSVKHLDRSMFNVQELAYFHFKRNFGKLFEFYMKLDLDEFVYTCDGSKVSSHLDVECVLPLWGYNFGSSGKLNVEPGLVIDRFDRRSKDLRHCKSINRTACVYENFNAHLAFPFPWKKPGLAAMEPFLHPVLRLNHYKTKSREEFSIRKSVATTSFHYGDFDASEFEREDSELNEVFDDSILSCRPALAEHH
jgi:hypothetical protein